MSVYVGVLVTFTSGICFGMTEHVVTETRQTHIDVQNQLLFGLWDFEKLTVGVRKILRGKV